MNDASTALIRELIDLSGGTDEVDHVWVIDECEPGMVLTPQPAVANEANRLYYVDLYCSGRLMLYIPATASYSSADPHRFLALDSNMFNAFKRYVLDNERRTQHVIGMEQLIDYAIVHRYSVLPMPYVLEIIAHRGFDAAEPYCKKIFEAVLRLQYMSGETFRSCRQFAYAETALDRLEARFGTRSFRLAAERKTEKLLSGNLLIRSHYYMSYLAVLALIAIGLQYPERDARITAFDKLLFERVGGSFPRYMLLARLFYYGKISSWIGSEPGNTSYRVQKIRAAAYDIALTMLNEEMMHVSDPRDPDVVMLVTRDRQLAVNAPILKLKAISLLKNGRLRVLNPWDEISIDQVFGKSAKLVRSEIDTKLKNAPAFEISPSELLSIIKEHENRLGVPQSALSAMNF